MVDPESKYSLSFFPSTKKKQIKLLKLPFFHDKNNNKKTPKR